MSECEACGEGTPFRINAYGLCAWCEEDYWSSPESRSTVVANIAWRKAGCPVDMSDPWDMVGS